MTHYVTSVDPAGWEAHLELSVIRRARRSELGRKAHRGPLRVQRALYPEGGSPAHVLVLHPPGGVVAGDRLHVDVSIEPGAAALVTTPAAQKLYRSEGPESAVSTRARVGGGAQLEWLPAETLVFDAARARLSTRIELEAGASLVGWEMLCLGRPASGLPFARGSLLQRLEILRDGAPLLVESLRLDGGSEALGQAWGLGEQPAFGTFYATTAGDADLVPRLREALGPAKVQWAATDLGELLVVRALAAHAEDLRTTFVDAWKVVRPAVLGREATAPRIWAT